ncbi:MAG: DUF2992 family protein [Clostridia bacterium]|jgi:hypothetical protein|nr:YjdF family protein [Lachnospiraceae bacterium]NCC00758.1 DUF2992 family protein [Clostridia bacterium]NCD03122.1 DUF2992 family protein [Clostridia bacterium]
MDKVSGSLQVFFEDPFWVGIFEKESDGRMQVCKVTFGAEPKDYEIQEFILERYEVLRWSPAVDSGKPIKERVNPKRRQREVKKQLAGVGIGTKSQQALKLQQEQGKIERKVRSKEEKEAEKLFQFELKQQKRKEKHRGR